MPKNNLLLVDPAILPPVFERVLKAKQLLASGAAKSASEASKLSGLSRSAFYKYRNFVFRYNPAEDGRIVTIATVLLDEPGVLQALISGLSGHGANILTVNQNIPVNGVAAVQVSARTGMSQAGLDNLIEDLRSIKGVVSLDQILGE